MTDVAVVQEDSLQARIKDALHSEGKTTDALKLEDLAGVDELHVGGLETIRPIVRSLGVGSGDVTLDLGSGLGGPARFIARETGSRVVGVDLSADNTQAGNELTGWVGWMKRFSLRWRTSVTFRTGRKVSMLCFPFMCICFCSRPS